MTAQYTCTFGSAPAASATNTATAAWNKAAFFTPDGSASGSANYTFGSLTVTDTVGGALGTISTPAASTTFTYKNTVTAPTGTCTSIPNTASIAGGASASQSVKVCGASNLTIGKTATPAFTRTYSWNIGKAVDQTRINTVSGGSATFNYTVNANETGFTDSAWKVSGTITVNNPNDWEAITVNLADLLSDAGGSCSIAGGTGPVTVTPLGSIAPAYTCTFNTQPAYSPNTNTATATWNQAAYFTSAGSASGSAGYNFGVVTPNKVNPSITVIDTFNGTPTTLGTLTATDNTPFAASTYTYPHTVTAPTATCATFSNTAVTGLSGAGQSASQSVMVCSASDLMVGKTAVANFNSNIVKGGPTSPVESTGSSTLNHTITVTESGWAVSGNITVTNPNNWEDIPASIGDSLSASGAVCGIVGGSPTVLRTSSAVASHACTFASAPPASGINTAMASWPGGFYTRDTSALGNAGYAFGSLTVTDTFNGGTAKTLGTIAVPAATTTYTDSYTVPASPNGACVTYPNIATITQTKQNLITECAGMQSRHGGADYGLLAEQQRPGHHRQVLPRFGGAGCLVDVFPDPIQPVQR